MSARRWAGLDVTEKAEHSFFQLLAVMPLSCTQSSCRNPAHNPGQCAAQDGSLLNLDSKLVIVCMLCQADLSSTPNVSEIALESLVNLLDCVLEVRIPLILQPG